MANLRALRLATISLAITFAGCGSAAPLRPATFEVEDREFDMAGAVQRLSESIQIPTISEPGQLDTKTFLALRDHLEQSFPAAHRTLEREIIADYSLLYTWRGSKPELAPILFTAHQDVVPIDRERIDDWEHPPFAGTIANGVVYGRGSLDDKVSIYGLMEAVEYLLARGYQPERTVYLGFGHDEETEGTGAQAIAATLKKRLGSQKLWFTLDEGLTIVSRVTPDVTPPVAYIGVAEKGYLSLELTAHGRPGHSSIPAMNTSIVALAEGLTALSESPFDARLIPPVESMLGTIGEHTENGITRLALTNPEVFGYVVKLVLEGDGTTEALIRTTLVPTILKAGIKDNVIPPEATAVVNLRLLPGDTIDSAVAHVREVLEDRELQIDVRILPGAREASPVSPVEAESFSAIAEITRAVFPDVIVAPGLMVGGTDGYHYTGVSEAVYRFLPVRLDNESLDQIHGDDEQLAIENYAEILQFYVETVVRTAGGSESRN